ncbi:uncharacterized protein SPPG_03365 [Spizellomyces punctatus DAOM BR117]|uniref:B30.2/SPRY domain-containing protein n=1 Tax=Spizellomyces punctatus (strain DAOM BR117) TaxID=645134 RepID=A0A0L0HL16_SPIPD|nr:uncharacterized protein SPPG_03365 [Spizellomyces punctatus DAOM BR117]KND01565.1 hypothetical protein SPPG_03365 [Spizellomyces punctatus DAOM BR117]|eukprot:XP_016609604.1 hypothetical protein SPPG_03365 [Spizellomyces punctatus DAOM BR117]
MNSTDAAEAGGLRQRQGQRSRQAPPPVTTRDFQTIKEICAQLQNISTQSQKETKLKGLHDLDTLKRMTERSKQEDEMALIAMEAVVSIVNFSTRKQILRSRLMKKMTDEKELSSALQQHRDEFTQFIWNRRMTSRKEMRQLFQTGPAVVCRFGDVIAESTLEALQSFERFNWVRLCKDKIAGEVCNDDDIPSYFLRQMFLAAPIVPTAVIVHPNRLELHLSRLTSSEAGVRRQPADELRADWGCVYATAGVWKVRLMARPTAREMVKQTQDQILTYRGQSEKYSFVQLLARLVDAVHPSHQLPAAVLAYPLYGVSVLKRRLAALGYDVGVGGEDSSILDTRTALSYIAQINYRLQREHRFYFEFSTPDKTAWRVGLSMARRIQASAHARYPGQDEYSFGFSSTGHIFYKDEEYPYAEIQEDPLFFMGFRTWGVLVDLYDGHINLVMDGKVQPPAFGIGAAAFDKAEQTRQRSLIWSSELVPTFALKVNDTELQYTERPQIRVNFGDRPFSYDVNAQPCNENLRHQQPKALDAVSILDSVGPEREGLNQDEEEKLHLALEKNIFRATLAVEGQRSFSQFPPSIYRRSLACTKIQRAWRRHRGRIMRAKIREEQYIAATLIQMMARKKLKRLRALKNEAAAKIQKNWRRRKFIWTALLRCIYQQPIPELHRSATVIQRKWRNWHMFKNSPIATKYNARIEDLNRAVNTIIHWWRPLHKKMSEIRRLREKHHAATTIQRVYRGYFLRQLLRPDLRQRLRALGESVARHRAELLRIRGAYILQSAWRNYLHRRVRAEKVRTRHRAAARIQALWKGYWVRSHIHLRFTYGEAVFLTAVCRSLRFCHFILKMYKPCGIVCPRREVSYTRDGQKIIRS